MLSKSVDNLGVNKPDDWSRIYKCSEAFIMIGENQEGKLRGKGNLIRYYVII